MKIKKEQFQIKIIGKCLTKEDILNLWKFGMNKISIVKKYEKDNKIRSKEALRIVEETLYEEVKHERIKTKV